VLIAQKILAGNFQPGFQTPGSAYGADLVLGNSQELKDNKILVEIKNNFFIQPMKNQLIISLLNKR
jgi:hypothetical protein